MPWGLGGRGGGGPTLVVGVGGWSGMEAWSEMASRKF